MDSSRIPIQIRWTDIDANRHLRHSAYYDFGAIARMTFLVQHGLTTASLEQLGTGIILFREEAVFKREIVYEDKIDVDIELTKASEDFSRWSIRHHIYKNGEMLAATINVDGAWLDVTRRKLTTPGELIQKAFAFLARSSDFQKIIRENRPA